VIENLVVMAVSGLMVALPLSKFPLENRNADGAIDLVASMKPGPRWHCYLIGLSWSWTIQTEVENISARSINP
jgi:hypothetical protein